jgi:uncharacterized protein YjiS (DUF1127 family)
MLQAKTLSSRKIIHRTAVWKRLFAALIRARNRHNQRALLADLDPHLLRDIGVDPLAATAEAKKPFWQP